MDEQQEEFTRELKDIRDMVWDLVGLTVLMAVVGKDSGLYKTDTNTGKLFLEVLKKLVKKYRQIAHQKEEERRFFEDLGSDF